MLLPTRAWRLLLLFGLCATLLLPQVTLYNLLVGLHPARRAAPRFISRPLPAAQVGATDTPPHAQFPELPDPCGIRVSNVFGSGMVIQRGRIARVWGWTGTTCTVDGHIVRSDGSFVRGDISYLSSGRWVAAFPLQKESVRPVDLVFRTSSGANATLTNVLVGDVFLCTGQSNVGSSGTAKQGESWSDVALAVTLETDLIDPPGVAQQPIRLFATGQYDGWASGPLEELATPPFIAWADGGDTHKAAQFSAVCYFMGRALTRETGARIPIGLIEVAWGGSGLQVWTTPSTFSACAAHPNSLPANWVDVAPITPSCLFFALLAPFQADGKGVSMAGAITYIGETNAFFEQNDFYECAFVRTVEDLRNAHGLAWFGTVSLAPWIPDSKFPPDWIPNFRDMQARAAAAASVDLVITSDLGDPLSKKGHIHPRRKSPIGERLAAAALSSPIYGQPHPFTGPTYERAVRSPATPGRLAVVVHFAEQSVGSQPLEFRPWDAKSASTRCPTDWNVGVACCDWFALRVNRVWHNATPWLVEEGRALELSVALAEGVVDATRFGRNIWPVHNFYNAAGLPMVPWVAELG